MGGDLSVQFDSIRVLSIFKWSNLPIPRSLGFTDEPEGIWDIEVSGREQEKKLLSHAP
jgi:hypothetical protein